MESEKIDEKWNLVEGLKQQIDGIRLITVQLKSAIDLAVVSNKLSVAKTAESASSVQIAFNSIVRLASDIGSVSSIIYAADSGNLINELCEKTRNQINKTAEKAEKASLLAMESSMLSSAIPINMLESGAENALLFVHQLLKNYFSDPDLFLSELLVHPVRIRKVPKKSVQKSGTISELEMLHIQSLADFWQSELADFSERKNVTLNRVSKAKERAELFDQVKESILVLKYNGIHAQTEVIDWGSKMYSLSHEMRIINRGLKLAVQSIKKLSDLLIRRKALNPLISDELISCIVQAIQDSETAIKLFAVAMKSTYSARPDKLLRESAIVFGYVFYLTDTGKNTSKGNWSKLQDFIDRSSRNAKNHLIGHNKAEDFIVEHLKVANEDLLKAKAHSNIEEYSLRAIQAAKGI